MLIRCSIPQHIYDTPGVDILVAETPDKEFYVINSGKSFMCRHRVFARLILGS